MDGDFVNCTSCTYTEIYQTFLQALRGIRTHYPSVGNLASHSSGHVRVTLVYMCVNQSELSFILPLELSRSLPRMCNRSRPFRLLCDTIQYFNNVSQVGYCNRKQETRAGKQEVMLHCMFVIPASSSHLHTVERSR